MKILRKIIILPLIAVMVTACSNSPNKQQGNTFLGGILGGILGSNVGAGQGRTAAIIGGTMLGAYFGNSVGRSLDRADEMYMQRAQNYAFEAPVGQQINWNNPQSGNSGMIVPIQNGRSPYGNLCREFQQTVIIGGQQQQAYGTACKQNNGQWHIVN